MEKKQQQTQYKALSEEIISAIVQDLKDRKSPYVDCEGTRWV